MNDPNVYSPFKAAHHHDKMEQFRKGEQPVPLQVQMIISDLCNHDCSFCAYRMSGYTSNELFGVWDEKKGEVNNNPNRMIPYEKCLEILDDCADMGVKAIQYTGGGEPTVHPKHQEIMQYTLDKGLDLALVTNGTLIRDGLEDILVKGKWVRVSIDAGKKETYSKVRSVPEAYFQRTLDNLQKLAEAKRADPNSELIIGIGFVVTKENWMEIYEAVQIFSQLGVDNVRISAMFSQEDFDYHKGHYTLAKEATKRAKADFERSDYKVFDLFGDRIEDLKQHRPDYEFCPYMHLNTYIGGDLNVYTCCNNAYSLVGEMGSIKDQSFREFWESQAKEKAYGGFKAPTCERCMFNAKNRFMNYLLEEDPAHVNYI